MRLVLLTLALMASSPAFAAIATLQGVLDSLRADQDVPGVSAVVTEKSEVIFSGGSGVADIESGRRMTADTLLYAGSLTKILTASLILELIDSGQLSLDEPVGNIAGDQSGITVSHLLTHSSGLVREGNFGYWFNAKFPDDDALGSFLRETELRTFPGETVRYSNIGYAALGALIEDVTGESYHQALQRRVLQPLGMLATGSPGPVDGIATGYTPSGRIIPSESRPFAGVGREVSGRYIREYHDARAMTPAFGAYTTANDLGRLARFLLGRGNTELLSPALRSQMLEAQNDRRTFGLGTSRFQGRRIARHGGWFAAHKSHILIDLDAEVGIVVLANSDSADPDGIAKALLAEMLNSGAGSD